MPILKKLTDADFLTLATLSSDNKINEKLKVLSEILKSSWKRSQYDDPIFSENIIRIVTNTYNMLANENLLKSGSTFDVNADPSMTAQRYQEVSVLPITTVNCCNHFAVAANFAAGITNIILGAIDRNYIIISAGLINVAAAGIFRYAAYDILSLNTQLAVVVRDLADAAIALKQNFVVIDLNAPTNELRMYSMNAISDQPMNEEKPSQRQGLRI